MPSDRGLQLDGHKRHSTAKPLRAASPPVEAVLALDQQAGMPAAAVVSIGDAVLLGQPIAQAQSDFSAWLHSPVSGRVTAIEPRPGAHHAGEPTPSIVIASDGEDRRYPANSPIEFRSFDPVDLCEHIARGGIVGLGGAAFPTAAKLLQARASEHIHLVLNGVECEPWISCDDVLMREHAQDVILGAQILCYTLRASKCTIAVESDMPEAQQAVSAAIAAGAAKDIVLASIPRVYPAGGERQLITTLTGLEVPFDGLPPDIGVVCQNVGTAAAIARWIRDGEPLVRRIVTLTGSGIREPCNLDVRLGTSIASLIEDCGGYQDEVVELLMGGSMMGRALPRADVPVIKGTNCVVAATASDFHRRGAEMPCIRCGNCSEVCPAILMPQQLHWYALGQDLPMLERYGLLDCIECGCCDHVCPSQIPLTQRFREAKPALLKIQTERSNAAEARVRFESREQRLARLEDERRARLSATRKAFKEKQ